MNYEALRKTATSLLRQMGFQMTLTQRQQSDLDVVAGTVNASSFDFPVRGIKANLGKLTGRTENTTRSGYQIQQGDVQVILEAGVVNPLSAEPVTPRQGDILTIQGVPWRVMAADGLDPGGVDLLFSVWVHK